MKKTAVLLYPGFSEYELSVAMSVLMQGHKPVVTAGSSHAPIRGEAGMVCVPDSAVEELDLEAVDSLLLPGCMDIGTVIREEGLLKAIREAAERRYIVAAISSSPALLAMAGVLKGKRYTVGLSEAAMDQLGCFEREHYSSETVVRDGNMITARGRAFVRFGWALGRALELPFEPHWYTEQVAATFH
jgi:protein deglycase